MFRFIIQAQPSNGLSFKVSFFNNCLISWAQIGPILSSIRVQTDKILLYARFQQFNFQLANCQPFNQSGLLTFFTAEPLACGLCFPSHIYNVNAVYQREEKKKKKTDINLLNCSRSRHGRLQESL